LNNFKISTIESSNGYAQVTISGNSVHDDFLYSGSPQTSKYFEIKATSASVIAGNVVCAAEARSTQEIAGAATGNGVRDNDWFVNNVLQ
jgi:methylaspartate ammonia-lyase